MLQPGRKHSVGSGYRYGFNGKEKDNEVKVEGNQLDFGSRVYDSRIGRFLSTDPLQKKYPSESPYIFSGNSPITMKDVDGKYKYIIHLAYDAQTGKFSLLKIEKVPGLMAKRREVREQACGDCGSSIAYVNDWYDYIALDFTVVNGQANTQYIFVTNHATIGGAKYTGNYEGINSGEAWAKFRISDGRTGVMWSTKNVEGIQGADVWGDPDAMENIDNFTKLKDAYEESGITQLDIGQMVDLTRQLIEVVDEITPPIYGSTDRSNKPANNLQAVLNFIEQIAPEEPKKEFSSVKDAKDYFNNKSQVINPPKPITYCRHCDVNYDPKTQKTVTTPAKDTSSYHEKE